jgi:hypothetical protein
LVALLVTIEAADGPSACDDRAVGGVLFCHEARRNHLVARARVGGKRRRSDELE